MPNRNNKCRKYERRTTKLNFYLEEGFKIKSRRIQKLISKNVIPDSEICMDIIKKNITNYNFPKEDFNYLLEFANIDKDISLCKKIIKWCLYAENKLSFEMRTKIDEIVNIQNYCQNLMEICLCNGFIVNNSFIIMCKFYGARIDINFYLSRLLKILSRQINDYFVHNLYSPEVIECLKYVDLPKHVAQLHLDNYCKKCLQQDMDIDTRHIELYCSYGARLNNFG